MSTFGHEYSKHFWKIELVGNGVWAVYELKRVFFVGMQGAIAQFPNIGIMQIPNSWDRTLETGNDVTTFSGM